MNADGHVVIDTKLDTSGAEKGAKNLKTSLKDLGGSGTLAGIAKAATAVGVIGAAAKAAKEAIDECGDAFLVQAKAEQQLSAAAKNNPYLDGKAVAQLKEYASSLQQIGTAGDEAIIPLMAQLAAAGRSQKEIQDIMRVSLDVSATGTMSLESAVRNLNKTFSGMTGELGEAIPTLKTLTAEELKSGKAIEVMAAQYGGISAEVTAATGAIEQAKNASGDLKEAFGSMFQPIRDTIALVKKELAEMLTERINNSQTQKLVNQYVGQAKAELGSSLDDINITYLKYLGDVEEETLATMAMFLENQDALNAHEQALLAAIKEQQRFYEAARETEQVRLEHTQKKLEAEQAITAELDKQKQREQTAAGAKKAFFESLDAANAEIEARKKLGETYTEQEIRQERINALQEGLLQVLKDSNGTVTLDNAELQPYIEELKTLIETENEYTATITKNKREYEERKAAQEAYAESFGTSYDEIKGILEGTLTETERIESQIAQVKYNYEQLSLNDQMILEERYIEALKVLEEKKAEIIANSEQDALRKRQESLQQTISLYNDFVTQYASISNGIADLLRASNEKTAAAEQTELANKYTDGLISYEEYCDKRTELSKKAAREEYKIKLWEWTANLAMATASIAQGVAAALAKTPPYSYVLAGLTSAAGAIQLAAIMAAKPQMPSFYTGGFVGGINGASSGYDNTTANVRNGELIMNAQQQRNLWEFINTPKGGGATAVSMNVDIQNNTSATVKPTMTARGLRIVIDEAVKGSMADGRYNVALDAASSKAMGTRIL